MAKRSEKARVRPYTRSLGEELDYLRRHLKRDEAQILAAALRRGVFETYKSLVLKQYAASQITARQASDLLGEKLFGRVSAWLAPQPRATE